GQHRPVQVFHLVTRDSIEERVLRALAVKRNLFEGVFAGGSNEVVFDRVGQTAFLDTVRDLIGEEPPASVAAPAPPAEPDSEALQKVLQAGVQFLEALAALLPATSASPVQGNGSPVLLSLVGTDTRTGQPVLQLPLPPPELLQRGSTALQTILTRLATS